MSSKSWFVHIMGENLGPLPTEAVKVMLRQNRLQFTDFIWCKGNKKWHRIYEMDDFEMLLPAYPDAKVPDGEEVEAPRPAETKTAAKKPEPKAEPKPEPAREFPKVRRAARVDIEAQLISKEHGAFIIVNVSEGGVFLKADELLSIGTEMKFTLQSNKLPKILDMTGVVIRHSNSNDVFKGFAVEFVRVNPAYKRLLQEYVKTQTGEE